MIGDVLARHRQFDRRLDRQAVRHVEEEGSQPLLRALDEQQGMLVRDRFNSVAVSAQSCLATSPSRSAALSTVARRTRRIRESTMVSAEHACSSPGSLPNTSPGK